MWELDYKESWVPKHRCFWTVVLEKTLMSTLDCKEINPCNPKGNQVLNIPWGNWCWSWSSNTLAADVKNWLIGKDLMLGKIDSRRRDNREWDGWMESLTQWTWVWASSGSWWWTEKPGILQSMGFQSVGHDWATELNWKVFYLGLPLGDRNKDTHLI